MRNLNFDVDIKRIIQYLGKENFVNKESAILELVKNSCDAGAKNITIDINLSNIVITDDGIGMSMDDVEKNWMVLGASTKRGVDNDEVSGEKGIGRLAISRIGDKCVISTHKLNSRPIKLESNWETTHVSDLGQDVPIGTRIEILDLVDSWNDIQSEKLGSYLSKLINKSSINIVINNTSNKKFNVVNPFSEIQKNVNYFLDFEFNIIKNQATLKISNELFSPKDIAHISVPQIINLPNEIKVFDFSDISGHIYWGMPIHEAQKEKYKYKPEKYQFDKLKINNDILNGIILYRNGFGLQGYDGSKDWLGIGKKNRSRNKSYGDSTGKTSFRHQHLNGYINISKSKHKELMDLSNRQSLMENEYYLNFIVAISSIFEVVEDYLKECHLSIYKEQLNQIIESNDIKNSLLKLEKKVVDFKKLSPSKQQKALEENMNEYIPIKKIADLEDKYELLLDDSNYLELISSQSILFNSIIHDYREDITSLKASPKNLRKILMNNQINEKISVFEYLAKETKGAPTKSRDFTRTFDTLDRTLDRLTTRLNFQLSGIKKERFINSSVNMEVFFAKLKDYWFQEKKISDINISNSISEFKFLYSTLDIVFYNLIDNSIKHNNNAIQINIVTYIDDEYLTIEYFDSGSGLDAKYRGKPFKILERNETSKLESTGLGMWIINKRVLLHVGNIDILEDASGFKTIIKLKVG